jgi:Fungal hydrophobin.
MKFTLTAVFGLATIVTALPSMDPFAGGVGNANGIGNKGNTNVKFPVPDNMTVKQAQAKCGDQAQLSCCNKATYAGDTTDVNSGLLGGALSNLIGAGSGADGLGLFDQCSKLDAQSKFFSSSINIMDIF